MRKMAYAINTEPPSHHSKHPHSPFILPGSTANCSPTSETPHNCMDSILVLYNYCINHLASYHSLSNPIIPITQSDHLPFPIQSNHSDHTIRSVIPLPVRSENEIQKSDTNVHPMKVLPLIVGSKIVHSVECFPHIYETLPLGKEQGYKHLLLSFVDIALLAKQW